jgi:hypothetical protein
MANPTCTRATLTEGVGNGQNALAMNKAQYEWAKIWLKILELAAIGGTDYRSALNTLITDATELAKTANPFERRVMWLNILRNDAIAAGSVDSSLAGGVSGLNIPTNCCLQPFSDREAIDLLLTCKLGVHKAYVQ